MKKYIIILIALVCSLQLSAQENCIDFNNEQTTVLSSANSAMGSGNTGMISTPLGNWTQGCTRLGVYNNQNSLNGTNYLFLKDVGCGDMGSSVWNSVDFIGNWIENASCFCYDYNVINNGNSSPPPPSAFTIYNGTSPTNATLSATFILNSAIQAGSGWHTICPPIALADSEGTLPSNQLGFWRVNNNGTSDDWNNLITDVGVIRFSVDIGGSPTEEYGIDNLCFQSCPDNQQPNPTADPLPSPNCYETPLGIANVPNTPSPLPIRQVTEDETTFSVASETFQIHENQPIPITEIRVSVIDLIYKYNYESCGDCVNNPALWGSLMSQSVIGEKGLYPTAQDYTTSNMISANQNVRELVWTNPDGALLKPGDKFDVNYILPPASEIPCCVTEVQVCTQISWKDANCCYNDIKTCSTIKLESEQTPDQGPSSTCECGEQSPIVTISSNNTFGNTPSSVKCGDRVNLKLFKSLWGGRKIRYSFDHPGNGVCKPESCNSGEFWTITDEGGRLIRQGTGNINQFQFPSTGTYNIEFTPSCGGNDCKPCEFKVNVRR